PCSPARRRARGRVAASPTAPGSATRSWRPVPEGTVGTEHSPAAVPRRRPGPPRPRRWPGRARYAFPDPSSDVIGVHRLQSMAAVDGGRRQRAEHHCERDAGRAARVVPVRARRTRRRGGGEGPAAERTRRTAGRRGTPDGPLTRYDSAPCPDPRYASTNYG